MGLSLGQLVSAKPVEIMGSVGERQGNPYPQNDHDCLVALAKD
jgi:hypothetical protein